MNRPVLRYYGGKYRLANWIISFFPSHYTYVEPFGGAANVLLQKTPSRFEVYNDLDSSVVTFFRVLRERKNELIEAIKLTPWSREEARIAIEQTNDELETARRFYVRCWQSFNHISGGWRYQYSDNGYSIVDQWNDVSTLYDVAERLKGVQIENDDAMSVIRRFDTPDTLFYVDPPYLHETRYKTNGYMHEMTNKQHVELADLLNNIAGMAIVSGYDSELYRALYDGWAMVEKASQTNNNTRRIEVLWISPNANSFSAMPLFGGENNIQADMEA